MFRRSGCTRKVYPHTGPGSHGVRAGYDGRMRELQKAGKMPQFGSFKYSAARFYDKGILLSIENYSPRQFDKLDVVMSSNTSCYRTMDCFLTTLT